MKENNSRSSMLSIKALTKRFDGVIAVNNVEFDIFPGEIISLIGPNGSGKTTLFNCVTGFLKPEKGIINFNGKNIVNQNPSRIALSGICRTFQNVRVLPSLTVKQNLMVSLQQHQEENILNRAMRIKSIRDFDIISSEKAEEIMEQVGLTDLQNEEVHNLVYGQRKLLEFACALIPNPDLIMLDEPAAGVSTAMVDQMKENIVKLNQIGKTFLIVEHNMGVVMDISHRIVVLDHGKKIAEGKPHEIREDVLVREAYFGR
jgi:branched-chain amino acid transport system ATP-binding protein